MVGDERQGWALFAAMAVIFLAGVAVAYWAEGAGNPNFAALGLDRLPTWKARRSASASPIRPVGGGHHRRLQRRGQLPCTTASRRSAG